MSHTYVHECMPAYLPAYMHADRGATSAGAARACSCPAAACSRSWGPGSLPNGENHGEKGRFKFKQRKWDVNHQKW